MGPFGVDNPSYSLMNNSYMSVYLHYLGRTDNAQIPTEKIQTEFRCTIHSCLGSQQDLYQELQHKFCIGNKQNFLSGFKNFLPLSLLFRTPFYLFPDNKTSPNAATQSEEKTATQNQENKDNENNEKQQQQPQKRNMAILKTELWIFPPLDWKKTKPAPKSPIYIDLLDDSDDDDLANKEKEKEKEKAVNTKSVEVISGDIGIDKMPTLEKDDKMPPLEQNIKLNNNQKKNEKKKEEAVIIDIDDDEEDKEKEDVTIVDIDVEEPDKTEIANKEKEKEKGKKNENDEKK